MKPSVSFVFPIRWIKEDKDYLASNLYNKVESHVGRDSMSSLKLIQNYRIVINCQSYRPPKITLTAKAVQTALKKAFPSGKCIELEVLYLQHRSKTILPTLDMQIFF